MARPHPDAPSDPATSWALGASLALLAAALTGLLLGWLSGVRGVHGVYITFAMPVLIGSLIGWAAAMPARRLRFPERRPLVAAAVLGAILCALAHHAFAFLSFSEAFARANPSDVMVDSLADPVAAAILFFERATGETGYFAYLAFTGRMPAAEWSPIGLLGTLELGVGGTLAVAGAELALLIASATLSALLRTRSLRGPGSATAPTPFALCDDAQLLALGAALDAGDVSAARRAIHGPTTTPTHALCLGPGLLAIHPLLPSEVPGDDVGPDGTRSVDDVGPDGTRSVDDVGPDGTRSVDDVGPDGTRSVGPLPHVAPQARATRAVPAELLALLASPPESQADHAHP